MPKGFDLKDLDPQVNYRFVKFSAIKEEIKKYRNLIKDKADESKIQELVNIIDNFLYLDAFVVDDDNNNVVDDDGNLIII